MYRAWKQSVNAAQGKAWVDWAAWGGVVRGNADALEPLARAGVPGFKCFLIHSGIDGFAWVDEADLRAGACEADAAQACRCWRTLKSAGPVNAATKKLNEAGADWRKYSTYLASRPDAAEVDAIALLIRLAEEFQTPIHIVHLSSAKALPLLAAARDRGVPITVETCVHYLGSPAKRFPTARRNSNARRRSATPTTARLCGKRSIAASSTWWPPIILLARPR